MSTFFLQNNPADSLTFDNVDSESFAPRAQVTSHPIETGSDVTDHVQQLPTPIQVRGRITDTPLSNGQPGRVDLAFAFFERARGQLVTYVSRRDGSFPNLVITGTPRSNRGLDETVWDVSAQEILLGSAVSVPIPARQPRPEAQVGLPSEEDAGQQPPQPTQPSQSFLATMGSLLGGG